MKEFCFVIVKLQSVTHIVPLLKTCQCLSITLRIDATFLPHPEALWDLSLVFYLFSAS